jgi:hypothetical protein
MTKISILVYALILFSTQVRSQGLYNLNQSSFIGIEINSIDYDKVFDMDGELKQLGSYSHLTTTLKAEYKIQTKWSAVYNGEIYVGNKQTETKAGDKIDLKKNGIGDQEIGVRYRIKQTQPWLISVGFNQGIGLGDRDTGNTALNTGYGDYCQYLYFDVIYYNSSRYYFQSIAGIRNRNKGFSDVINLSFETGYRIFNNLWFMLNLEGIQPIENGDKDLRYGSINNGLYSQDAGWLQLSPQMAYESNKGIGFKAGVHYTIKGQFNPAATAIFGCIYYRIKSE